MEGAACAERRRSAPGSVEARLSQKDLRRVNLARVSLRGANLEQARLADATLAGSDLSGATLTGADLRNADLRGANLEGAHINLAKLGNAEFRESNCNAAWLLASEFPGTRWEGATFEGAKVTWSSAPLPVAPPPILPPGAGTPIEQLLSRIDWSSLNSDAACRAVVETDDAEAVLACARAGWITRHAAISVISRMTPEAWRVLTPEASLGDAELEQILQGVCSGCGTVDEVIDVGVQGIQSDLGRLRFAEAT